MKRAIFLSLLLFTLGYSSKALNTITWDAGGDGVSFNDGNNWSSNSVPTSADSCVIIVTTDEIVNLTGNITVGAIYMFANGTNVNLELNATSYVLTVEGDLVMDANGNGNPWAELDVGTGGVIVQRNFIMDYTQFDPCYLWADATTPGYIEIHGNATFNTSSYSSTTYNANIIFDGSSAQTITYTSAAIIYCQNLTFGIDNAVDVTFTGASGFTTFSPVDGNTTISDNSSVDLDALLISRNSMGGTLTLGTNSTLTIGGTSYYPANYATDVIPVTSTVIFDGTINNVSANVSAAYGNLTLKNTGVKTMTEALTVEGNFLMEETTDLDIANVAFDWNGNVTIGASNTFYAGTATHTIAGDFSHDGAYTHETGKISFDGTSTQTVSGTASANFNNFHINNTTGVTISKGPVVDGVLEFEAGDITASSSSEPFTLGTTATIDGTFPADDASHVVGYAGMQTDATTERELPVGSGSSYRAMYIQPASTSASTYIGKYVAAGHSNTAHDGSVNNVSHVEYWEFDNSSGTVDAQLKLTWDANSYVANTSDVGIAQYNGSAWASSGTTTNSGTTSSGDTKMDAAVGQASLGLAKPFTLSSSNGSNPLPVELISFTNECNDDEVIARWETASELNNDYFELYTSRDGLNFEFHSSVNGNGTTSDYNEYEVIIDNKEQENLYLKLTQVDFDGETKVYPYISSDCQFDNETFTVQDQGNNLLIEYNGTESKNFNVYDLTGKLVTTISLGGGNTTFSISKSIFPTSGIYFLTPAENNQQTVKIFIR